MVVKADTKSGADDEVFGSPVTSCFYLLGFNVQALLSVAGTFLPQISLLGYMGGDEHIAAVRKC
jgi:hypothetical protein